MNINSLLHRDWREKLKSEMEKRYFQELIDFVRMEYEHSIVYPAQEYIFQALNLTSFDDVKVVLLGQDPYHGPNQAHGLSFSVLPGVPIPPSLKNIDKELEADLGCNIPDHGYLKKWAEQGVLLLNTVLTVRAGEANSHQGRGWETFTDRIITCLNDRETPIIFVLWGKPAQKKRSLIDEQKHFVMASSHPSPLSAHRGFFGSRPFSRINQLLRKGNRKEIDWGLSFESEITVENELK
ncbi:uracil-DNA glycosylase [Robertmurraya sp. DFI.2.37]|uniref:uracil-DNA glycosylase n=1 Tax=Robertmurraya sp. DFI.2.37 TaxID=3031819 RepID=UPI001245E701|nr:uracil-DNA glycosylase [Robertmurraya sp. DFI.2.37]MDF1507223.1 uracil-DNA glycosylase [Robertmurraya sp. DFI.2.37]